MKKHVGCGIVLNTNVLCSRWPIVVKLFDFDFGKSVKYEYLRVPRNGRAFCRRRTPVVDGRSCTTHALYFDYVPMVSVRSVFSTRSPDFRISRVRERSLRI